MRVRSLTIDLDGTLVDSAEDLALACNAMLAELGRPAFDVGVIREFVGMGMRVLVERCLDGEGQTEAGLLDRGVALFRKHYALTNGEASRLYPGVREGLVAMRAAGLALGCVTNKPAEFTLPLLERLGLSEFFSVVVSGDTLAQKKPHPAPILHACAAFSSAPQENIHIGDSIHDVEAALAAGSTPFVVPYGYSGRVDIGAHAKLVSDLVEAARAVAIMNQATVGSLA